MLNLTNQYYVAASYYSRDAIEKWANENGISLNGEALILPNCGRVYELDVSHNNNLNIRSHLSRLKRPELFLNGKQVIGYATYVQSTDRLTITIYPEIKIKPEYRSIASLKEHLRQESLISKRLRL